MVVACLQLKLSQNMPSLVILCYDMKRELAKRNCVSKAAILEIKQSIERRLVTRSDRDYFVFFWWELTHGWQCVVHLVRDAAKRSFTADRLISWGDISSQCSKKSGGVRCSAK